MFNSYTGIDLLDNPYMELHAHKEYWSKNKIIKIEEIRLKHCDER